MIRKWWTRDDAAQVRGKGGRTEEGDRGSGDWQYSGLCTKCDEQAKTLTGMTRRTVVGGREGRCWKAGKGRQRRRQGWHGGPAEGLAVVVLLVRDV